jgi:hypothetical protein
MVSENWARFVPYTARMTLPPACLSSTTSERVTEGSGGLVSSPKVGGRYAD